MEAPHEHIWLRCQQSSQSWRSVLGWRADCDLIPELQAGSESPENPVCISRARLIRPIAAPLERCAELLGVGLATVRDPAANIEPYVVPRSATYRAAPGADLPGGLVLRLGADCRLATARSIPRGRLLIIPADCLIAADAGRLGKLVSSTQPRHLCWMHAVFEVPSGYVGFAVARGGHFGLP